MRVVPDMPNKPDLTTSTIIGSNDIGVIDGSIGLSANNDLYERHYKPAVYENALAKKLQDLTCSRDELLAAVFLGDWEIYEEEGIETTVSQYQGKTYILNVREARHGSSD